MGISSVADRDGLVEPPLPCVAGLDRVAAVVELPGDDQTNIGVSRRFDAVGLGRLDAGELVDAGRLERVAVVVPDRAIRP